MTFTSSDPARVNRLLDWKYKYEDAESRIDSLQSEKTRLEEENAALKRVAEAAMCLESHPAFCVGTRSCENLPQGIMGRMEDLRETLKALEKAG